MLRAVPKPSFERRVPKRFNRGNFSKETRKQILMRDDGLCRVCGGIATQIHHVQPKSSGKGRGVFTNGMSVCNTCHDEIHRDNNKLSFWQEVFKTLYGDNYFKDEWDG